jgi:Arc/MetJ family transcription regulator
MRTTLAIKEDLLQEAKKLSGARTIKDTVEIALDEFIRKRKARRLIELEGKVDLAFNVKDFLSRRRTDVPH